MTISYTEQVVLWTYAVIVAVWPIRHLVLSIIRARLTVLDLASPRLNHPGPPRVTAIIPAKDEEATLPACLDSVIAQRLGPIEILVVDDRSVDGTRALALERARHDPRVRVIGIEELPPGWTGKTHALHVAAGEATGDWLWFVDADTRHHPDCLSIVLAYADRERASLVSLLPEMRCESFWEKVVTPLAGIVLMRSYPLFIVNDDRKRLAFANGQFLMIIRDAYDEAGGHASVRDRFVEDIGLARRVKGNGRPIRVAVAPEISSTRMYTSLGSLVRGWSRILYDALDRRVTPLVGKIVEPLIFSQTGDIALLWALALIALGFGGPFAWWLLGLSVVHQVLKQTALIRMYAWTSPKSAAYALYYPLAGIVTAWILIRSIGMCLTGRVTWRGTAYGAATPEPTAEAPKAPSS